MPYQFDTTPTRSRNMQAIKSANNATTERRVRAHLSQLGVRGWRIRPVGVPGNPDFVFPVEKVAIFVDGCFWHCCPGCGHIPKSNAEYWKRKLKRNKARDRLVNKHLRSVGFRVIRLWECEIKRNPVKCIQAIVRLLSAPNQ
jgi:DNA mismatch endonuclease (patch repair protein)